MRVFYLLLVILYPAATAAFGGWRGREMWTVAGDWWFLLPILVVAVAMFSFDWRDSPDAPTRRVQLQLDALALCAMTLVTFGFAWAAALVTGGWLEDATWRAVAGVAFYFYTMAAGLTLTRFAFGKSDGGTGRGVEMV